MSANFALDFRHQEVDFAKIAGTSKELSGVHA